MPYLAFIYGCLLHLYVVSKVLVYSVCVLGSGLGQASLNADALVVQPLASVKRHLVQFWWFWSMVATYSKQYWKAQSLLHF